MIVLKQTGVLDNAYCRRLACARFIYVKMSLVSGPRAKFAGRSEDTGTVWVISFSKQASTSRPDADRGSTQPWRTVRGVIAGATDRQPSGRGTCNANIDRLAGRSGPSASNSGPRHQGLAPASGRCAVALRLCSGRRRGAEYYVVGHIRTSMQNFTEPIATWAVPPTFAANLQSIGATTCASREMVLYRETT
jgi:hypothetical protein